jgi:hypothetical protein
MVGTAPLGGIAHELLTRCGTFALLRFTAAMLLITVLHLIRVPLVVAVRVLSGVIARADAYATRYAFTTPTGPVNAFTDFTTPVRVMAWPVMGGAR